MEYEINGHSISYTPEGKTSRGSDQVLLDQAIDLTANTSWSKNGFTIADLFELKTYDIFRTNVHQLLVSLWKDAGLNIDSNFVLDQYHNLAGNREVHLRAVDKTKLLSTDHFPIPVKALEERISKICGIALEARNPFDQKKTFHFRVIRPQSIDNNPLHRDVWLEDYDNCINLYIPIAGSNIDSSLIVVPGSHRWPESRLEKTTGGAVINGVKFNVPAVTDIYGKYEVVRPDPKENEVLVFSPYLIHGGSVNFNSDQTRISIEIRLWRKD